MFRIRGVVGILTLGACFLVGGDSLAGDADRGIHGKTFGHWDLPTGPHDTGEVKGALFVEDHDGPVLLFKAVLSDETDPGTGGRHGKIKGVLFQPTSDHPAFIVLGHWEGKLSGREGVWKAQIYSIDGHEAVGKMAGHYTDPKPFKPGGDGKHKGKFIIED